MSASEEPPCVPRVAGGTGVLHRLTQLAPRLQHKATSPPSAAEAPSGEVVSILGPSGDEAVAEGNKSVALGSCGTSIVRVPLFDSAFLNCCFVFFFPPGRSSRRR